MKTNKYWQVLLSFTLAIFLVVIIPTLAVSQNEPNDSKANTPSIESLIKSLKEKCTEIENRGFGPDNQQSNTKILCEEIEKLNKEVVRNQVINGTQWALFIYFLFGFLFILYNVMAPIMAPIINKNKNNDIPVNTHWMLTLLIREFRVIVLIPISVGIAILLVLILEQITGPIEFIVPKVLEFKGASGPIIFWILCFLTLVHGLNKLWVGDRVTNTVTIKNEGTTKEDKSGS